MGSVVSTITSTHSSASVCQSSFMPIVMKNRPSSTSWNGRMSVSTWCLYSVSAISMPATNAPSASDSPASSVTAARPSVTPSRLSMNSSSLLRREMAVRNHFITFCPPDSSTASTTTALMMAGTSVLNRSRVSPPSAGMITSSGTTARSWNSSTPITRRPCSLSSSSRSAISLTTSAVLDIAIALPSTAAACQLSSQWRPSSVKSQISARLPRHRAEDGDHHLRRAQPEHERAHRAQLGQVELEPDHEHQEHDAELGQRSARRRCRAPAAARWGR